MVRSHLKYFQSPLFSVFVMCIERGCWLRMHSTQYTINKVSRTNVFYALFEKRNKILLAAYSKYSTFWINIKICHLVINMRKLRWAIKSKSKTLYILIYLNNGNANTIYLFALTTDFEQPEVEDTYQTPYKTLWTFDWQWWLTLVTSPNLIAYKWVLQFNIEILMRNFEMRQN